MRLLNEVSFTHPPAKGCPMSLYSLMSSAQIASTSVKTGPLVSRRMAAALNGPAGQGAVADKSKGSPALVVRRKGTIVGMVSVSDMLKK